MGSTRTSLSSHGTCAKLFEKKGDIGNTTKSKTEDFFASFWTTQVLFGMRSQREEEYDDDENDESPR